MAPDRGGARSCGLIGSIYGAALERHGCGALVVTKRPPVRAVGRWPGGLTPLIPGLRVIRRLLEQSQPLQSQDLTPRSHLEPLATLPKSATYQFRPN